MKERLRNAIQKGIYALIARPVSLLVRIGVTPNHITTLSLTGNIIAAALIILAPNALGWAGIIILLSSSLDMVDGYMARTYHMATPFGAFYDSVIDRYSELVTLGALSVFLMQRQEMYAVVICFAALVGSIMVSYIRARAEGLGAECKVGLMQRPERVVVTAVGCMLGGFMHSMPSLVVCLSIIAILSNGTAVARIIHVKKHL